MNDIYIFEEMNKHEKRAVHEFVRNVFNDYVAPGYSQEGINTFMNFIEPDFILERINNGSSFVINAKDNKKIIGVIEIKNYDHISLLFVDKNYHNRGIAKELYKRGLKRCLERNAELKNITVNSSPYAVGIYAKLGFKQVDEEQIRDGIRFVPMEVTIEK